MTQLYHQASQQGIWMALGPPQSAAFALGQALTLTYGDGTQDTLLAHVPAVTSAGTTQVDRTGAVWLLYVVAGDPTLRIVREMDQGTIAGSYAPLARVLADRVVPYQPDSGQAQSSTSGQSFLPLTVTNTSSTQSIGGSTTVPVATSSSDYVVQCHLSGSTASAVWNALSDKTSASDLQVIFGGAEIDADIDQQTNGAWSSSNITLWFRLQRPIGASGVDQGYQLRVGGGLRSSPPRNWANIYPFSDDFLGSALDSTKWTATVPGSYSIGGSILQINTLATNTDNYLDSVPTFGVGRAMMACCIMSGNGGAGAGFNKVMAGWHGCSPYVVNDAETSQAGVGPYNGLSVHHVLWPLDATYQVYGLAWLSTTQYVAWKGSSAPSAFSDLTSSGIMPVLLDCAGSGFSGFFDWAKVRPYVSPEPTVSAGTLQSAGALVWQPITDSSGSVLVDSSGNAIMALSSL